MWSRTFWSGTYRRSASTLGTYSHVAAGMQRAAADTVAGIIFGGA